VEGREGKGRRVPPLDLNPGDATASIIYSSAIKLQRDQVYTKKLIKQVIYRFVVTD